MQRFSNKQFVASCILFTAHSATVIAADNISLEIAGEAIGGALSGNGIVVSEGDILTNARPMMRGTGVRDTSSVWKDGIVPYYIDPELQNYLEVIVESAVANWNAVAGITLVKINPRDWDAPEDYLHFMPASGCASWVGRQGGAQSIWTGAGCSQGSMMHEIGHALGLEHEHTRPDRDRYISINWENIDPTKIDNFAISDMDRMNYGPYDYESIMHYGEYFFSANNEKTIVPITTEGVEIGQRILPSAGDIKAISMLYSSDISLVSQVVTESGYSEVSLLVSNEHLQGANMLELYMDVGSAQLMASNNPEWDCIVFDEVLSCSLDRLAGADQSTVVLGFDQTLNKLDLNPTLSSKTPDDDMGNNGGDLSPAAANLANNATPYSDQQLQAKAGGLGYSIAGLLLAFRFRFGRKKRFA